jgi:transposase
VTNKSASAFVCTDPTEIVEALVGLKDVRVLAYRRVGPNVSLLIEQTGLVGSCPDCGGPARVKERPVVTYVDLPVYGHPMRLAWRKHRMRCVNPGCSRQTWTCEDYRIAAKSCLLTTRCAKWATVQVGGGRTVSEVAAELACDWHTVSDAVTVYGAALLAADRKRLTKTRAIGLDETSFIREAGKARPSFVTTVADVEHHQIIDLLPTNHYAEVAAFINTQSGGWKGQIEYGALDMSATYAAVYTVTLPKAAQVVDPFHVIALANRTLDAVRRRVQTQQTGHLGRRDDPLYRARRVLLRGEEKLDEKAAARLTSLLALGDPDGEVAIAYRMKERLREFYRERDIDQATAMLTELIEHAALPAMPAEVSKLGRTLKRWSVKICNYHLARLSNAPTEALNNLIKRIKRIGFGFRNFDNYRIRVLLYAGKPNWRILNSIVVR